VRLCKSLCRSFPTMIDPLDTPTNYLDWGRLDQAETICGTVLKAKSDDSWVLCVLAPAANARKAHARVLDYLARAENAEFAHLCVETAGAHPGLGAYGAAVRAADQAALLAPDSERLSSDCQSCMPPRQLSPSAGVNACLAQAKQLCRYW
jgi:hypothetical protein